MSFRGRSFRPKGNAGRPPPRRDPVFAPRFKGQAPLPPRSGRTLLPTPHGSYESPVAYRDDRDDYRTNDGRDRHRSPKAEYTGSNRREFDDSHNTHYERRQNSPFHYECHEVRSPPSTASQHVDRESVGAGSHKSQEHRATEWERQKTQTASVATGDRTSQMVAVEKAKEMALRTREIIEKLGGFKQVAQSSATVHEAPKASEEPKALEPTNSSSVSAKLSAPEPSTISRLLQNDTLVKYAFNLPLSVSEPEAAKKPEPQTPAAFPTVSAMEHENQYVYESDRKISALEKSAAIVSRYAAMVSDSKIVMSTVAAHTGHTVEASYAYRPDTEVKPAAVSKIAHEAKSLPYGSREQPTVGYEPSNVVQPCKANATLETKIYGYSEGYQTNSVVIGLSSVANDAVDAKPVHYGYTEEASLAYTSDQGVIRAHVPPAIVEAKSAVPKAQSSTEAFAKGYDPTIANILKSIGFNFELSSMMQEKARTEKQPSESPNPVPGAVDSRYPASQSLVSQPAAASKPAPVVYEQMANRYREDQTRQLGERQVASVSVAKEEAHLKYKQPDKAGKKGGTLYEDFSDSDDDFAVEAGSNMPPEIFPQPSAGVQQSAALFPSANAGPVPKSADDLDWELNTQEFIRKLQQPRPAQQPALQQQQPSSRTVKIIPRTAHGGSPAPETSVPTSSSPDAPVGFDHVKMMKTLVPIEELRTIRKTIIVGEKIAPSPSPAKPDAEAVDIRKSIKIESKKPVTSTKAATAESPKKKKVPTATRR